MRCEYFDRDISSLSVRETNKQIKVLKSKPSSPKRQKHPGGSPEPV